MENFIDSSLKFDKFSSPNKVLQALKKIQFILQFFVLSKYSDKSDVIAEFLMAMEAFKFYYKMAHFSHQQNLYLQNNQEKVQKKQKKEQKQLKPLQKMSQLLQKIKTKSYQSQNHQPEQFEELASGKKMQLITSVKVPQNLKRTKLSFVALLGEVLSLLRPLISIIGIRLFGLNNYRSYFLSLGIDLIILLVLQRNIKVCKKIEMEQLEGRKKQLISRYLFRKPLFIVLKKWVIEPLLKKFIRQDRIIYKLLLSILQMQSSITLTYLSQQQIGAFCQKFFLYNLNFNFEEAEDLIKNKSQ